jgi:hypothetical protein
MKSVDKKVNMIKVLWNVLSADEQHIIANIIIKKFNISLNMFDIDCNTANSGGSIHHKMSLK